MSPDVRRARPGLRALRVRCASAPCLRLLPQPGSHGWSDPSLRCLSVPNAAAERRFFVPKMRGMGNGWRQGSTSQMPGIQGHIFTRGRSGLPTRHRRTFAAAFRAILFGTADAGRIDLRLAWLGAAHALSPGRSLRASVPSALSEVSALSPSGLRWPPTPARGHGQPRPHRCCPEEVRARGSSVSRVTVRASEQRHVSSMCVPRTQRPQAAPRAVERAPTVRDRRYRLHAAAAGRAACRAPTRLGSTLRRAAAPPQRSCGQARLEGEPSPGWSHLGCDHAGPSLRGPWMAPQACIQNTSRWK